MWRRNANLRFLADGNSMPTPFFEQIFAAPTRILELVVQRAQRKQIHLQELLPVYANQGKTETADRGEMVDSRTLLLIAKSPGMNFKVFPTWNGIRNEVGKQCILCVLRVSAVNCFCLLFFLYWH
jgi:hypothetical protein